MKTGTKVALGAAGGLTAVTLAGAYATYLFGFHSPNKTQNIDRNVGLNDQTRPIYDKLLQMIDEYNEIPFERVSIVSRDGLKLLGRYYETKAGAPLLICCHGWRSTPARDFSGTVPVLLRRGYNLLLIEERAMCGSEGHTMTYGIRERYDVQDWARWATARFGDEQKIVLYGVSMGAATVLMTSDLELPKTVRAIIADCPYDTPFRIMKMHGMEVGFPGFIAGSMAILAAGIYGGFSVFEGSPLKSVKRAKLPILIIHGEDDLFVPGKMSEHIAAANPRMIERVTFPEAGHARSFVTDPVRYEAVITEYLDRVLKA